MTLGEKIKNARKAKGMTQKELAEKIGAKHNSVSDWEKNKNKPDMDTIELLCGVLEITPNYIMGTKTDLQYASIAGRIMGDPECMDMIEKFYSLSEENQSLLKNLVNALSKAEKKE